MRVRVVQAEIGERRHAARPSLGKAQRQRFTGELQGRVAPTALEAALERLQEAGVVRGHVLSLFVQKRAHRGYPGDRARKLAQQRGRSWRRSWFCRWYR